MTNTVTTNAQVAIKINGTAVSQTFMRSLRDVVVDTTLHLPSMFTIRLQDNDAKWADNSALLKIGNSVEISMTAANQGGRSGATAALIKGEITALEPYFGTMGAMLSITGYCKSHRLHRGKKTKTWLKQKDSAIVSTLASEAGLSATVEDSRVSHEYVIQYNQSDWEFLRERAARIGYRFYVENDALYFKKAANSTDNAPDLSWGDTLRRFQPRLTAAQQSLTTEVRGWDPKTKKEIVGTATASLGTISPTTGFGTVTSVASLFGSAKASTVTTPLPSQDYASAMAKATANQHSGRSIQAEGEAIGDPRIVAGKLVKIEGVGTRFGGTYTITAASHHYDSEGIYLTRFSINGQDPSTLYALLPNYDPSASGREYGVVIGLVTNIKDPEASGRVKVKFPWLSDTIESEWARVASPMAGPSRGFMFLPEVNDEVLVAFEQGDLIRPYILGALWNGKDKPPLGAEVQSGGKVEQRIIQTRAGHKIILVDKAGSESIKIVDKTGKNSIFIDSVKNDIAIEADGNITMTAKGKLTLSAQMDVMIESKTGKTTLKGTSGVSVQTPASMEIKGSTVQVQGSGPVTVKGNPIMLN
jgi:Rhs element Vgr protein